MKLANSFAMLAARVILGVILIAHGWQKFSEWTIAGTTQSFEGMGVPAASIAAPAAATVELVGGTLIILGLLTRIVGGLVALQMVGAGIFANHLSSGVFVTNGGWELVGVIAAAGLMLVAAGPGIHSLDQLFFSKKAKVAK
ncbi:hypothetical protein CBE89_11895 [Corynebacterium striatum]|uniref:DoxX family protein n=1 Tax=Corynebacterium striatum TaxID=43770 RepID=A0A2Z2J5K3_CORST|nr:DoxX family protein [Corynebacterium striatum]ART22114.1 hypothetical protein CBE89_11895 [Corynebacterium striatum]